MKGLLLLANHFEDTEALVTYDILRRSGIEMVLTSVEKTRELVTQNKIRLYADELIEEVSLDEFDFLVIPGGKAVFERLDHLQVVEDVIMHFYKFKKWIAAICAAPHLIGKLGLLENKNYVCFPNCNEKIIGGRLLKEEKVVIENHIITARAMAVTVDFALAIIETLQGKTQKEKIEKSIYGIYE